MNDEQRRQNGEKSKATFVVDVTRELDRLEALIEQQARGVMRRKIQITQASVAEAAGHHRTTFKGEYHRHLRERLRELQRRARDPRKVHLKAPGAESVCRTGRAVTPRPGLRYEALKKEYEEAKHEIRILRRQLSSVRGGVGAGEGAPHW